MMDKQDVPYLETHIVPQLSFKIRVQDYSIDHFRSIVTKTAFKKIIKKGGVLVNDTEATTATWLLGGETIAIKQLDVKEKPSVQIPLEILYEDDYLAIVNKPAGLAVSGNKKRTVAHALSFNLEKSDKEGGLTYPEPIHRLDYPTSGALLIGKTTNIVVALNRYFEERTIQKTYHAIILGSIEAKGSIETPIGGKPSITTFEVISSTASKRFGALHLVQLHPLTGRKHQLRKHLAYLGCPILGDKLYGKEDHILHGKGLYLHASTISFSHPITKNEILVTASLPKKFSKIFPSI